MRWWQVYVGCFAVVVLGAYPSLPVGVRNWDNIVKIQAATNFLAGKGFVITEPTPDDPTYLRLGRDGRAFTMYAPMAYVQQFPVLAMARLTGTPQEGVAPLVFLGLAAVMLVAAGRRNGANPAAATAGALMVCFGTALWASVTHGYDVLVEVFALSVILWAAKADDHVLNWLAPGLALGAALATRQSAALLLAPAAVVLLQTPRTRLFRRALIFTGGLLPWVLLILWFNWYRFGSPLGASGGGYLAGGMQISIAPWFSTVHLEGMAGLVVSPGKGDGRSFIAANLAIVFAQQGERTLLIDGDLRAARQQALFKLERSVGLSGILAGRAGLEAAWPVPSLPGLSVLPAGAMPPNPQELLGRNAFGALLHAAALQFDVIIIDTPAGGDFADAEIIAARAGAALMVARKNKSLVPAATKLWCEYLCDLWKCQLSGAMK